MPGSYRVVSPFLVRLPGVSFNVLAGLRTPQIAALARALVKNEQLLATLKRAALDFVRRRDNGLDRKQFAAWRRAIRRSELPVDLIAPPELAQYAATVKAVDKATTEFESTFVTEVTAARRALLEASAEVLPRYLVFGSAGVHQLLDGKESDLSLRNSRSRERERHLLLYLQRIAAKNDTFSQFGPSSWGVISGSGLTFQPGSDITQREVFLERWTAHALAAAVNADPEALVELCPRLNPNGALVGNYYLFADTGDKELVTDAAALQGCDGKTPVHALNFSPDEIRDLARRKIVVVALEVPSLDPFAFETLRNDIAKWREGPPRQRWLGVADSLLRLSKLFAATTDAGERQRIMTEARKRLSAFGAERKPGQRSLYSALNPIAEECFRDCKLEVEDKLFEEVITQAEPWIDFWRDSYAFVAGRVAANLRGIFEKAPVRNGAIPLPAFLRVCEMAKLPLTGHGLVAMAYMAFQEVKSAFRKRLEPHAAEAEYKLTLEDCAVVRNNFDYVKFDAFTYASADLQLAADSAEAIKRGAYRWIASELHPAAANLHHCMFWSCPDQPAVQRAMKSITCGKPLFHFGFLAADFTGHTTLHVFDVLPEQAIFASPQRPKAGWRYVPPAVTEVFVDDDGDVALRTNGHYLGSFARNWIIPLGFHPFQFGFAPHTPRLLCGRVIVQRRTWTISAEELPDGKFTGLSRGLVLGIERLRAEKGLPRYVYIRPTEQALRRSGAEGRDKDTKPVFVDLESYLFLEIFHRWLTKSGQLEVTEMLPAPDELWWAEEDGRRTCEFRTLIAPK